MIKRDANINPEASGGVRVGSDDPRRHMDEEGRVEMVYPDTEPTDPEIYTQTDPEDLGETPEEGDPGSYAGDYESSEEHEDATDDYGDVLESGALDNEHLPEETVETVVLLNDEAVEGDEVEYVPGTYTGEYRKA